MANKKAEYGTDNDSFIEDVYIHWNVGAIMVLAILVAVAIAVGIAIAYSNGAIK